MGFGFLNPNQDATVKFNAKHNVSWYDKSVTDDGSLMDIEYSIEDYWLIKRSYYLFNPSI